MASVTSPSRRRGNPPAHGGEAPAPASPRHQAPTRACRAGRQAPGPAAARDPARARALPALRTETSRPDTPALRAERVEAIRRDLVRRRRRMGLGGCSLKSLAVRAAADRADCRLLHVVPRPRTSMPIRGELFLVQSRPRPAPVPGPAAASWARCDHAAGAAARSTTRTRCRHSYLTSRDALELAGCAITAGSTHFQQPRPSTSSIGLDHGCHLRRRPSPITCEMLDCQFRSDRGHHGDVTGRLDGRSGMRRALQRARMIGYAEEMVNQLSVRIRIRMDALVECRGATSPRPRRGCARAQEAAGHELQKLRWTVFTVEGEVAAADGADHPAGNPASSWRPCEGGSPTCCRVTGEDGSQRVQRIRGTRSSHAGEPDPGPARQYHGRRARARTARLPTSTLGC